VRAAITITAHRSSKDKARRAERIIKELFSLSLLFIETAIVICSK
jgi:hypothetical protein